MGNLQSLPEIDPNTMVPIVRSSENGRELAMARWGLPTPPVYFKGHKVDRGGVTNIRNPTSTWWKHWEKGGHIAVWCRGPPSRSRYVCLMGNHGLPGLSAATVSSWLSLPGSGAGGRRCGNWRMERRRMICSGF
jgi:hypothetical protein